MADNNLLHSLDALTHSPHKSRRTTSLILPRSSDPRPHQRRPSMSPFRSRPHPSPPTFPDPPTIEKKKPSIWNWRPIRALSRIAMRRISVFFSVEVVTIQNLPSTINGLRLFVSVRKKESKQALVRTMPARVVGGAADFEETLFIKTHVYCSAGKPHKFEPRVFVISPAAVEAPELDFGRSSVDLSLLVKESVERSFEGSRVRQWDAVFELSGKGKGGKLVIKLGFQIMEDGGAGIYGMGSSDSSAARRQSKSSFSVSSPRKMRPDLGEALIEEFDLDEDEDVSKQGNDEELDIPEFDVVDKGLEEEEVESEEDLGLNEEVKEVVHDNAHLVRLSELESIASQIKALELVMIDEGEKERVEVEEGDQELYPEEEMATREFLQMLELEGEREIAKFSDFKTNEIEEKSYLSDLGKGLGSVVHTRDGGYLTSMNPFDAEIMKIETPKLAMQISRPVVIDDLNHVVGFELFQKISAKGLEEVGTKLVSMASMDELMDKSAEQIAFEGIASAIVSGRNKEMATSTAAKSAAGLKSMARAMNEGREERALSGIWNVGEEPLLSLQEILSFSLQKMEAMAVEGLKVVYEFMFLSNLS